MPIARRRQLLVHRQVLVALTVPAAAQQRTHDAGRRRLADRGRKCRPAVRFAALERQPDVAVGLEARDQLELRAGEFLQQHRNVIRIRAGTGGADDDLLLGVLQILESLVGEACADREQCAVGAGRAQPLELPHVEAHRLDLGELGHGDRGIAAKDGQSVGFRDVEDMVGGVEMRAAGHLPENDGRIAREYSSE